ncbi:MAG: 5'/3'-nucleotidase SurE [Planctomycetales bacterium]|nr:5'/3'-nucleotidase SurE [Planctomycetales bacterium]
MRILLTNDDGIEAPGIAALAAVAREFGEVFVVAPHQPCSGCGHRIVTERPLAIAQKQVGWTSVDGYPADCVRLGLGYLVPQVDLVLAGINDGANLGADVHVSGTLAAVREAALFQVPGIALSQFRNRPTTMSWEATAEVARAALRRVVSWPLRAGEFLNVNLPDPPGSTELVECSIDYSPLPRNYDAIEGGFQYAGIYQQRERVEDSDVHHCFAGAITVSRLSVRAS